MPTPATLEGIAAALDELLAAQNAAAATAAATNPNIPVPANMTMAEANAFAAANGSTFHVTSTSLDNGKITITGEFRKSIAGFADMVVGKTTIAE